MDGLITLEELQQSLFDSSRFDVGLAEWVIGIVSDTARHVAAKPQWTVENIPPAAQSVVKLAARRLYTNPDRMTREQAGDYSFGLDSSVTKADVFTPSELATLKAFAPSAQTGGLRVVSTRREDAGPYFGERVPDGTRYGFPWYGGWV